MIITKLIIQNFRSYFGEKVFEFKSGLNLILGSNGDGKTTFYDALDFVLSEQFGNTNTALRSCVSAKMFTNLIIGEKGEVKVSLEMLNNSNQKRFIEHSFEVEKGEGDVMVVKNNKHVGYTHSGVGIRKEVPVNKLLQGEALFPAVIKKYSLFKGERSLNIFDDKTTLQNLINLFSDIKDMEPYLAFSAFAETTSNTAVAHAQRKNKQTGEKAANLMAERRLLEKNLENAQARLSELQESYSDTKLKIESIEADFDTIELVHSIQNAIKQLESEIEIEKAKLNENYSFNLLDELWILDGFQPTLELFADKMSKLSEQKQILINLDKETKIREQAQIEAEQKTIEEIKAKLAQLPWYIPDIKTMQSMLDKETCLVCGTKAPKGSDAYNHIAEHLQEALDHLASEKKVSENSEIDMEEPLFPGKNIEQIHQLSIQLYQYGKNINEIQYHIEQIRAKNRKVHNLISQKHEQLDNARTKMAQILAQSNTGTDIGSMVSNWTNIKHWFADKETISVEIDRITTKAIPLLKDNIRKNIDDYKKCAESSTAKEFLKINNFFRLFGTALENAEERSLEEFMDKLADSANKFLAILNVDDFTGIIRIYRDIRDNAVRVKLVDKSGKTIENPNTSLYTTMHLSVLFAISELTKDNFDNEYPIILDAPTSSFDEGKDKTFYQVMNERLNKQCIVVTKSFLVKDDTTDRFIIDQKGLGKLLEVKQIPVYRIEKLTGFDKQDLSSIETIVTPIY